MKEMTVSSAKIPAHLANRIGSASALGSALSGGLGGESIPRISIKAARFRLKEDGAETVLPDTVLETVIVGANPRLSKTYYAKKWDPKDEPEAPDCFSLNGIRPDISIAAPENDLCATCPKNAWGSRVTDSGQQLKACADQKRLAVVAADDPNGTIYLLQVTPAALKGLNQYHKELAVRGIPAEVVRTRVSFDPDASFPKLAFSFGGFLDEETQQVVDSLFDTPEVKRITGELVEEAPAPAAPRKPVLVKPAPVVEEVEEEDEEEEEAPTPPSRGFGAKAAKPAPTKAKAKAKAASKAKPKATPKATDEEDVVDDIAAQIAAMFEDDEDDG